MFVKPIVTHTTILLTQQTHTTQQRSKNTTVTVTNGMHYIHSAQKKTLFSILHHSDKEDNIKWLV